MKRPLHSPLLAILPFFFVCGPLFAQSYNLDSLWRIGHDMEQADSSRLQSLLRYANQAYLKRKPDSAVYFADLVLLEAKGKEGLAKQEAMAYSTKGAAAFNTGNFKKAIGYHSQCLAVFSSMPYPRGIGNCYNNLANCYMRLGDPAKAMRLYQAALDIWISIGDKRSAAATLHNLGSIYMNYGDDARAIEVFTESLLIREELGDESGIAIVQNNIGILYNSQGDAAGALSHFNASLAIRKELGDLEGQASNMLGIGEVYVAEKKLDSALSCFQTALRINREASATDNVAQTLEKIAEVYEMEQQYAQAEAYCDSALQIYATTANAEGLAMIFNRLGEVRMGRQELPAAIEAMDKSIEIARSLQSVPAIRDAAFNLYKAHKLMGQVGKALEMHELFVEMRDSAQNEENARSIIRQELRYEFEKDKLLKAQEMRAAERIAKEAAIRRDRLQYSLISGIVIFLLIGMVTMGFLKIHRKVAFATVFLAFLVTFEFILVLIDPYTEPIAQGQPVFKFLINLGLALLLTPIHHFLEQFVQRRLLGRAAHVEPVVSDQSV